MIPLFILLILGIDLSAQAHKHKERMQSRLESYRKVRLMEDLNMSEDQSIQFFSRFNKQRENISEIVRERGKILSKLRNQIKSNSNQTELENSVKQYTDLNNKIIEQEVKFLDELKIVLTPQQVAEYVVFQQDFRDDLKTIMQVLPNQKGFRPQREK
ncbi:MAG: hypothetical protein O3A55_05140 [Bacteroidetes bacterium]|nr:hypothetical protein [Bacteroidota bacterium]